MWRKWRALSGRERRLTLHAFATLVLIRGALRWLGVGRVYQYVESSGLRRSRIAESPDAIGQAVARASGNRLVAFSCLPRALTLRRMLWQQGYGAVLHIGVQKQANRLVAHAWVTLDGVPVGDSAEFVSQFHPFANLEAALEWV